MNEPEPHLLDGVGRIPLRDRHGDLRGWALIDPDMLEPLTRWRWHIGPSGHVMRQEGPVKVYIHREVLGLPHYGAPYVRHRDGVRLDNRRQNLCVSKQWLRKMLDADTSLSDEFRDRALAALCAKEPAA